MLPLFNHGGFSHASPFSIATILLLFLCLLSSPRGSVDAQQEDGISISFGCSEEGTALCESQHRICLTNETAQQTEEEEEFCGPCGTGFVEFPESILQDMTKNSTSLLSSSSSTTEEEPSSSLVCVDIEKLDLTVFVEYFQPLFIGSDSPESNLNAIRLRLEFLVETARFVSEFNRESWNASYELALNEYSADTPEDTKGLTGYQRPDDNKNISTDTVFAPDTNAPYPTVVNWVERGAVTPVKNQGTSMVCMFLLGSLIRSC